MNLKKFDSFIKMQFKVTFLLTFSYSLLIPLITKLQGLEWSIVIISSFFIFRQLSNFALPIFKKVRTKTLYGFLIIFDVVYLMTMFIFFFNPIVFLYVESIILIVYGVIVNAFFISYEPFLLKNYEKDYKNIQYTNKIIVSIANILGFVIVIIINKMFDNLNYNVILFIIMTTITITFQIYNIKIHWKNINF